MVTRFLDAGHRAAWAAGDEVYGGNPRLRAALEERGNGYVLDCRLPLSATDLVGMITYQESRPPRAYAPPSHSPAGQRRSVSRKGQPEPLASRPRRPAIDRAAGMPLIWANWGSPW